MFVAAIVAVAVVAGGVIYVRSGSTTPAATDAALAVPERPPIPRRSEAASTGESAAAAVPGLSDAAVTGSGEGGVHVRGRASGGAQLRACYCGCERSGHRGNEDCFVKSRDVNGDVVQWEHHGMECAVCLDVATRARLMYASGASVADIRAAVEKEWAAGHDPHADADAPHALIQDISRPGTRIVHLRSVATTFMRSGCRHDQI